MKTFRLDAQIASFDYDGQWGKLIGPKSVQAWLKTVKQGEECEIEINSPGGSVVAGLAIANSIKNSGAKVRAHVIGIAASMASVIACACDSLVMEEGSFMMVHNPWTDVTGDARQLRHEAAVLDSMKEAIMGFYRVKFSGESEKLAELMNEETWLNGRETAEAGFVCEVIPATHAISAAVTTKSFARMPEAAAAFVRECAFDEDVEKKIAEERAAAEADDFKARVDAAVSERLAGAMKSRDNEINELRASLEGVTNDLAAANEERKSLVENLSKAQDALKEFENQMAQKEQELTDARAAVTSLTERAELAEKEFAACRDQLSELKVEHGKLVGCVLVPSDAAAPCNYREQLAALPPAERDAFYRAHAKDIDNH